MKNDKESRDLVGDNLEKRDTPTCENVEGSRKTEKTQEALSNILILQETFKNLSISDLKACGNVNSFWGSQANNCMRQMNVELSYSLLTGEESIFVHEINGIMRESKRSELNNFHELYSIITRATNRLNQPHIALSLKQFKLDHGNLFKFLKNFGHLVFRFNYEDFDIVSLREFKKFLWKFLPNLEELHMDFFALKNIDNPPFLPDENANKCLQSLKIISFFKNPPSLGISYNLLDEPILEILNMAPNLQIIKSFPVEKAYILTLTGKSNLVQEFQFPEKRLKMKSWLESLAQLKPKLVNFELPRSPQICPAHMFRASKEYITDILESSKETLEHLTIFPTQRHGYINFPSGMTGLRVLELKNESNYYQHTIREQFLPQMGLSWREPRLRFFHPSVVLRNVAPNLNELKISLEGIAPENVFKYFPQTTFQDLQISRLHVNKTASLCLENLSKIFSSVNFLTMDITEMEIKEVQSVIKDISRFPKLTCLRFEINSHKFFIHAGAPMSKRRQEQVDFDSLMTGLPEDICEPLRKVMLEDVETYRTEPSLLAIKGLKNLEFIFKNKSVSSWWWQPDVFPAFLFTEVSLKYGLRIYPHVNVTVRVEDEHPKLDSEMMMKAVGAVAKDIELDMSYNSGNF